MDVLRERFDALLIEINSLPAEERLALLEALREELEAAEAAAKAAAEAGFDD